MQKFLYIPDFSRPLLSDHNFSLALIVKYISYGIITLHVCDICIESSIAHTVHHSLVMSEHDTYVDVNPFVFQPYIYVDAAIYHIYVGTPTCVMCTTYCRHTDTGVKDAEMFMSQVSIRKSHVSSFCFRISLLAVVFL